MRPRPGNPRLSRILEGIAMLLLAVAAILFQRSAIAPWAEGRGPDGRRVEVSPIGITDYGLGSTGTAPVSCRWLPILGEATLCQVVPDGDGAMAILRRAYPLTVGALWTSVLALFLVALRLPRSVPSVGILATAAVPALAIAALWSFATGATGALSVLMNMDVTVAPRGFVPMFTGALFGAIAVGLLLASRGFRRN